MGSHEDLLKEFRDALRHRAQCLREAENLEVDGIARREYFRRKLMEVGEWDFEREMPKEFSVQ